MPKKKGERKPKNVNFSIIREDAGDGSHAYKMMRELIARHHPHLAEAKICLAWRYSWKPDKDERLILGQCKKASDLDRALLEWDFVILLNFEAWTSPEWDDKKRAALLDHELCHAQVCEVDGDVKRDVHGRIVYRIRRHEIEEFVDVVHRHGVYKRDLEEMAKAIAASKINPLFKATA